ncbi:MAG: TRAP transporter small permease subunit [Alphaproteobacteria bacterium]|nr:TRAP transporter small permease subunit [Alphaproteobacteria bacterium]
MAEQPRMLEFREPATLRAARSGLAFLGRCELIVVVLSLISVTVLTGIGVVLRYAFGSSLLWAQEIALLLMQLMVFCGGAVLYKARAYLIITLVFDRLSERTQQVFALATWIIACVFFAVVFWQAILLYPKEISITTFILELPKFYYTVPMLYASASLFLCGLYFAAVAALLLREGGFGAGSNATEIDRLTTLVRGVTTQ